MLRGGQRLLGSRRVEQGCDVHAQRGGVIRVDLERALRDLGRMARVADAQLGLGERGEPRGAAQVERAAAPPE